jgi:hypothetical protein
MLNDIIEELRCFRLADDFTIHKRAGSSYS